MKGSSRSPTTSGANVTMQSYEHPRTVLAFRRPNEQNKTWKINGSTHSTILGSIFLVVGLWTPELIIVELKIWWSVNIPPMGLILRSQFSNLGPHIQKYKNCRKASEEDGIAYHTVEKTVKLGSQKVWHDACIRSRSLSVSFPSHLAACPSPVTGVTALDVGAIIDECFFECAFIVHVLYIVLTREPIFSCWLCPLTLTLSLTLTLTLTLLLQAYHDVV